MVICVVLFFLVGCCMKNFLMVGRYFQNQPISGFAMEKTTSERYISIFYFSLMEDVVSFLCVKTQAICTEVIYICETGC